jgi:hypothetical protein
VLEHQPDGPLSQLLWIPAWSFHGSNLSRVGASKNPGTVHSPFRSPIALPSYPPTPTHDSSAPTRGLEIGVPPLQLPDRGGSQPLAGSSPAELSRLLTAPGGAYPASGRCPDRRRRRGQVGRAVRRSPLPVLVHHWTSAQAGSSSGPVSSRPVSARRVSSRPVSARRVSVRDRPVRPSGVRPSGVQPAGVRPSVLWRPSRLRSARRGPWDRRSGRPSRLECVGFGVACRVPERLRRRRRGLDAGDAAEVVGPRSGRVAVAGRGPAPGHARARRRPRSAADRPGRPPWPGSLAAGGYPGPDAQLRSVVVVEPTAPSGLASKAHELGGPGWPRGPSAAQPRGELAGSGADDALSCESSGGRDRV